jgi:tetratricopeptide (TPR) repeat protein
MPFEAAKCTRCGGNIQVPNEVEFANCMYCGAHIRVREALNLAGGSNPKVLLGLARTAIEAGQALEAEDLFQRVLEIDPTNIDAWLGRGEVCLALASLADTRIAEANTYFLKANEYSGPSAERESSTSVAAASLLIAHATRIYVAASAHYAAHGRMSDKPPSHIFPDPKEFAFRNSRVSEVLQGYFDAAVILVNANDIDLASSDMKSRMATCVDVCGIILQQGWVQTTGINKGYKILGGYQDDINVMARAAAKAIAIFLKRADPSYELPAEITGQVSIKSESTKTKTTSKSSGPCFVATAACGHADHPLVNELRRFRDEEMQRSVVGLKFIEIYYRVGPRLAKVLICLPFLRAPVKYMLIMPIAWLARPKN